MLTILNVAYPFAPVGPDAVGGAEQILTAIDEAVLRAGHRSLVLACSGSRPSGQLFEWPGQSGVLTEARRGEVCRLYRKEIERIIAKERVDVVHFHGVDFAAYLPDAPTPVLATLHLPPEWYEPEVFAPRRPRTYLNCVSASQLRRCPPSEKMLGHVPNGVDLSRFRRRGERGEYALVLGRICPEKGIHVAIEAARRARVPLLIGGDVFAYPEHVRYFGEEIEPRLGPTCRFIGRIGIAEKPDLLARARCVVVASLVDETSSLVALEALASGTPVVAFPKGALPELIDHGKNGFLVNDVEQMKEAVANAQSLEPSHCRTVAERFPAAKMNEAYLELYRRIAS